MNKKDNKSNWLDFLTACSKMMSLTDLNNFFSLFLTFEEKETIASRYLIIKALLSSQLTQRRISEIYNVSIAQITRGSNALKVMDSQFKEILKDIIKEKESL